MDSTTTLATLQGGPRRPVRLAERKEPSAPPLRQGGGLVSKQLETHSIEYLNAVGNEKASAWWNGPGCIKLQFNCPELAHKFQRSGVRHEYVGYGVTGGYLRLYNVSGKTLSWFNRWLKRNDTSK
jgi:hypothetical protein